MIDRTANLLGVVGLAVADRIERAAREILNHSGETPAALVVIGYGTGPSNDELRKILGLSHSGTVRLTDRLVADGLVDRRKGNDKRAVALFLTDTGMAAREELLNGRIEAIRPLLKMLPPDDVAQLDTLLHRLLASLETSDLERRTLCRLCKGSVCTNCPIPAGFRSGSNEAVHAQG